MGRIHAKRAAAVVVLAIAAACSGGSPKATGSSPASTISSSPISPALSDKSRAETIVLAGADFPAGWQGTAHTEDAADREFERRVQACAGVKPGATTTDVFGDDFTSGQASVGSEAQFFKSATIARADIASVNNTKLFSCVRTVLIDELKAALAKQGAQGATLSSVSLVKITVPKYADQSAGIRLTATVTVAGQAVRLFQEVIVARKGRVEATASFFDIGSAFPASLERSLFSALSARLVADGGA
jgi:hypothetical protein